MSRFRILWIDDQKEKCRRDVRSVEKIVEDLGFEADVKLEDDISKESLEDADGVLNKAIHARDVDLFVIDYNLKNRVFGSDVIEEIRRNHDIYSDIIFYSSEPDLLLGRVKESFDSKSIMDFFDGVYIAPLGYEFLEKVKNVIEKNIKSWYNVHSIRGVVLSKASKFEQMVNNIINNFYQPCLAEIRVALEEKSKNSLSTAEKKWKAVNIAEDPIQQIVRDPINFNWAVKQKIIDTMIEKEAVQINNWAEVKEIFEIRNKFAHNPMHLVNGNLVLEINSKGEIYTEEDVDKLREKLMRVEQSLERLQAEPEQS